MKKVILFILLCIISIPYVQAGERFQVDLKKCVDGDTAWFYYNDTEMKTRFLAINTPESTNKIEEYGKEASEFTCNELTNAKIIELEYDDNSDKLDKYDRYLAWVFVDGELLNKKIIDNGLAEVKYLYGDYKYTDILQKAEENAKSKKLGMWSNNSGTFISNNICIIIIVGIIILCLIITSKVKNKNVKKISNKIKSKAKKDLKNLLK